MWLPKLDCRLGGYVNHEINNVVILLISSQKLYFSDDDAIYDLIIQEPVWKWRHNYRYKISRDPFAESVLFQTYAIIFILRQIDRANFVVRGPSSLKLSFGNKTLNFPLAKISTYMVVNMKSDLNQIFVKRIKHSDSPYNRVLSLVCLCKHNQIYLYIVTFCYFKIWQTLTWIWNTVIQTEEWESCHLVTGMSWKN